jgi:diguanylate cyclase (GGDEF)-like protein
VKKFASHVLRLYWPGKYPGHSDNNALPIKLLRGLRISLFAFLLLIGFHATAKSTPSIALTLNENFWEASLTPHLLLLEDPGRNLTLEDIQRGNHPGQFAPAGKNGSNLGFSNSAWWVSFSIVNTKPHEAEIILRQAYPLIDFIDLWENTSGNWLLQKTGDRVPFDQRSIAYHDFLFPFTLAPHSEHTFFMRFESAGAMDIALSASSAVALIQNISVEQFSYGVYYGGFLVLVIYNFFIFVVVRDKAFLYYLLYILCFGLYMSANDGFFFQFFMPDYPAAANLCTLILLGLSLLFAVQFSRHILTIHQFSKKLNFASLALITILGMVTFSSFFFPYARIIVIQSLLTTVVMPLIFIMGIARLCSGYPPARYFMLAWSTFIIGIMIYMVKVFGYLPRTFFTENIFQIGSLIEMVLLSLALSSRVNELKKQSKTDALTEIPNRRNFDEFLHQEFQRTWRGQQALSLLMIDIDHFKKFNDTYGHSQGDRVLKNVAGQLRALIRKPMMPFRFGGEEFAVVLPRTNEKNALIIAERLRQHISGKRIGRHQITVSIGLACQEKKCFNSPGDLLNAADEALYGAKDAGRDCVINYSALPEKNITNTSATLTTELA